jgi:hypothetical protein
LISTSNSISIISGGGGGGGGGGMYTCFIGSVVFYLVIVVIFFLVIVVIFVLVIVIVVFLFLFLFLFLLLLSLIFLFRARRTDFARLPRQRKLRTFTARADGLTSTVRVNVLHHPHCRTLEQRIHSTAEVLVFAMSYLSSSQQLLTPHLQRGTFHCIIRISVPIMLITVHPCAPDWWLLKDHRPCIWFAKCNTCRAEREAIRCLACVAAVPQ